MTISKQIGVLCVKKNTHLAEFEKIVEVSEVAFERTFEQKMEKQCRKEVV